MAISLANKNIKKRQRIVMNRKPLANEELIEGFLLDQKLYHNDGFNLIKNHMNFQHSVALE